MNRVFLSLGGNLGNVQENLQAALENIVQSVGDLMSISSIYQTKSWGVENQPDFLNMAVEVATSFTAVEVLGKIQRIETLLGRVRKQKWGSRTLDIDILFYNAEKLVTNTLIIPHPLIEKRRFVLAPLSEIAPEFNHPVLKKTIEELLADCKDELSVRKLDFTKVDLPNE